MKTFLLSLLIGATAFAQVSNNRTVEGTNTPGFSSTKNYVKNPNCAKNVVGITASGGTLAKGTTTPLNEDTGSECAIDASASGQTYTWALNTFGQGMKGQNCEARFIYEGDASLYKAYINNGSTKITTDLQLESSTSGAKTVSINFPCGDLSAANSFVVEATDNAAAAFSNAKVYVGLATNLSNVAQASFYGSLSYPATTNCAWTITQTTYAADFSADTDCGTAVVAGKITAPATKVLTAVLTNSPPGDYLITATFSAGSSASVAPTFAIYDDLGTQLSNQGSYNVSTGNTSFTLTAKVSYTTAANRTFSIRGKTSSGSTTIYADGGTGGDLQILVYRFPSASELSVRPDNSNYGWTAFTPSTVGSNGLGTIAAESCFHKRDGKDLLIDCKITVGTTTGAEARITLPNSLTISATEVPAIRLLQGYWVRVNTSATSHKRGAVIGTGGNAYINFSLDDYTGTNSPLTATLASTLFASSDVISFFARVPITGWVENNKAPLLVGSVTSNSSGLERIERVTLAAPSAGACAVSNESGDWINGNATSSGTGACAVTINTGIFSATPVCVCNTDGNTGLGNTICRTHTISSTGFSTVTFDTAAANADKQVNIICMGQR